MSLMLPLTPPITGKLFSADEPDGTPVTIIGIVRPSSNEAEMRAIFVDVDGYVHEDEARQLEFTSAAPPLPKTKR